MPIEKWCTLMVCSTKRPIISEGEIDPLAFDKIRIFFDKDTDCFFADAIQNGQHLLSRILRDNTTKEYTIRKFKD